MKKINYYILSSLSVLSTASFSDEDIFLDDFSDDLPIVISASRLNQSVLTSPSSVTVIDKAMIEASGFIEFADLLRLVPGFQVAHVDGRRFAVAYHGLGSDIGNRLQVLVNGRSTYTPTLSTVDWDFLGVQLEDIEHIEVVRGSSASAYGSNSFTAAINIITTSPEIDDSLYYHFRKGNKGEEHQIARFSDSIENINYRFTTAQRKNGGIDDYRDSRDIDYFSFHAQFNEKKDHPINIYLNYSDGTTGTEISSSLLEERDREATSWSAHIQGKKILSQDNDIKWNFYHNSDEVNDLSDSFLLSELLESEGIPFAPFSAATGEPDQRFIDGDETNDATKTDIEVTYNAIYQEDLKYMLGTGVRYDTLRSISYFNEKGKVSDTTYRLFGNAQIDLAKSVTFNSGAIYEYVDDYRGRFSPRASLNFHPSHSQSLRISASRGYRMPSLLEKNFDKNLVLVNGFLLDEIYLSDENIKPEKIDSYDIGYLGQLSTLPISWDLKLYQDKITDVIGFPRDLSVNDAIGNNRRLISNNDTHEAYGIEGEITYRTTRDILRFHFNYGRTKTEINEEINPSDVREFSTTAPRESYGILGSTKFKNWKFNLSAYHVREIEWLNVGDRIESYTRIDSSISTDFKLGDNTITLELAAQNLRDEYQEFDSRRFFEPRYYATLSFTMP